VYIVRGAAARLDGNSASHLRIRTAAGARRTLMKMLMAVVFGLLLPAAPAFAANGRISRPALAQMGLAGMHAMSDAAGTEIRGTPQVVWPPKRMTYVIPTFNSGSWIDISQPGSASPVEIPTSAWASAWPEVLGIALEPQPPLQ
jgi:hypothetical protein